jgi:hypothetical protein
MIYIKKGYNPWNKSSKTSEWKRFYRICKDAYDRCFNTESKVYKCNYGGRGITMYGPWTNDLSLMVEYISKLPDCDSTYISKTGHKRNFQIDRIENDGNYEPDNLRFVNSSVQNRNKRPMSVVGKENLSKACKKRVRSKSHCDNLSRALSGRTYKRAKKPVKINGILYQNAQIAMEQLHLTIDKVRVLNTLRKPRIKAQSP